MMKNKQVLEKLMQYPKLTLNTSIKLFFCISIQTKLLLYLPISCCNRSRDLLLVQLFFFVRGLNIRTYIIMRHDNVGFVYVFTSSSSFDIGQTQSRTHTHTRTRTYAHVEPNDLFLYMHR